MDSKKTNSTDSASHLVELLSQPELQESHTSWLEVAAALVAHIHAEVGGCVSRKWQVAAATARVLPALLSILSHRAASMTLKIDAVDSLRLTISSNSSNQQAAFSAAAVPVLIELATVEALDPPPSLGPKAAALARSAAHRLRIASLAALAELVHMHKPSQDAVVAAGFIHVLIPIVHCAGPPMHSAAAQACALRLLAHLVRGNVSFRVIVAVAFGCF